MTKKEAIKRFKEQYSDFLKKYKDDDTAKRIAFSDFIDFLCCEGLITEKQMDTWSNPF